MKVLLEEDVYGFLFRLIETHGKYTVELICYHIEIDRKSQEIVFDDLIEAAFHFRNCVADQKRITKAINEALNLATK